MVAMQLDKAGARPCDVSTALKGSEHVMPLLTLRMHFHQERVVCLNDLSLKPEQVVKLDEPIATLDLPTHLLGLLSRKFLVKGQLVGRTDTELRRDVSGCSGHDIGVIRNALKADGLPFCGRLTHWRRKPCTDDVPNRDGVTVNGDTATQAQVDWLNASRWEAGHMRRLRNGDVLLRRASVKTADEDAYRLSLMDNRFLADDVIGGWTPFVTLVSEPQFMVFHERRANDLMVAGLNRRLDEILPAGTAIVASSRLEGGRSARVADVLWKDSHEWMSQHGVKFAEIDLFTFKLDAYGLKMGEYVHGFVPE